MLFVSHCQIKASLKVWRHCHCCSNSGNVTGEADFQKIMATFKYYFLSCFDTHTHSYPHLFCNSTLCIYQLSNVASSFAKATCFGHLLWSYTHLKLLFLIRETLLLYPRQSQEAGCVFISGGCFPPPLGCMWSSLAEVISAQLREQEFIAACAGLTTSAKRLPGTRCRA